MPAPVLLAIFDSVYLIALSAWVGSNLFFTFGVAPIVFQVLGSEAGGKFVGALFPRYYLWGVISSAVALPALVCGTLTFPELRRPMVGVQAVLVVISLLIMLYGGNSLTPAISAATDEGPPSADRVQRLRRRSVYLNGFVLLIGLALLVAFASRKVPTRGGIVEKPEVLVEPRPQQVRPSISTL